MTLAHADLICRMYQWAFGLWKARPLSLTRLRLFRYWRRRMTDLVFVLVTEIA